MKAQKKAFLQMLSVIGKDGMLLMACLLPVVCGILFRLGIPGVEALLCTYFQKKELLSPFYGLTDVFYSMLAPAMFCFAAAMVVLEERDEGMASYLCITPLGRNGYLISRLGVPAVLAAAASGALLVPFSLQRLQGPAVGILAVNGGAYGLLYALLILRFSSNRHLFRLTHQVSNFTIFISCLLSFHCSCHDSLDKIFLHGQKDCQHRNQGQDNGCCQGTVLPRSSLIPQEGDAYCKGLGFCRGAQGSGVCKLSPH